MTVQVESPLIQRTASSAGFTATRSVATALRRAAIGWTAIALVGQLVFAVYVTVVFGGPLARGDLSGWSRSPSRNAYVPGDVAGNTAMAVHVMLAVVILLAGLVQLLPVVRRRWPAVHRWSGRGYLAAAMLTSLGGTWLIWMRGTVGDLSQHLALTVNAGLLIVCAVMAWRTARARDFAAHRRWALRTYMTAGGVFFFRLGLFGWLVAWQRPVGFDPRTFSGPFLTTLAILVYVVGPLTILEGYLRVQRQPRRWQGWAMVALLVVLSLATAGGVMSATFAIWWPRIA